MEPVPAGVRHGIPSSDGPDSIKAIHLAFRPDGTLEFLAIRDGAVWRVIGRFMAGPGENPQH